MYYNRETNKKSTTSTNCIYFPNQRKFLLWLIFSLILNVAYAKVNSADSLRLRVLAFQHNGVFQQKDTLHLVDIWYLCAEYYQLGESDSMRKYADLGLNKTLKFKNSARDKNQFMLLDKYEMIFYKNIGISYFDKDDYTGQLKYFHKYLHKARALKSNQNIGTALSYIASCHRELEDYDKAFTYAQEAYTILQNTDNKNAIGGALAIYGSYYFDKKVNYDSSYYWKKKVYDLYNQTGYLPLLSGSTLDLIEIFVYFHEFDSARKYLSISKELVHELEFPEHIMTYNTYQAIVYFKDRNLEEARNLLTESMKMARETEVKEDDFNIHKYLSLILAAEGSPEAALKTIDSSFNEYSEDVNLIKARSLTRAQMDFEFEKERIEALVEHKRQVQLRNFSVAVGILLFLLLIFIFQRYRERNRYNQVLSENNVALESALETLQQTQQDLVETEKQREAQQIRVRIARDIHDDIGSSLTKITMLSDITRNKIADKTVKEALEKVMTYSQNVSSSLAEIVWAIHPENDHLGSLIGYMKSTTLQLLENSSIKYLLDFPKEINNMPIHPEIKRNIYLVLKEAVHNVLKYSEASIVQIIFKADTRHFFLEIRDNGIGFDTHAEDRRHGNGLLNMKQRMIQHGNVLEIRSSPGNGCSVIAKGKLSI
jgi:signal transduction histidine kinase